MTALIPENCWKNIRPREIKTGFIWFFLKSSIKAPSVAIRSLSICIFWMESNSSLISAVLPRNHCNDFRASFIFPFEMYHLGVSGIRNIRIKNIIGIQAPSNARFRQARYIPAVKHIKIPEESEEKKEKKTY